MKKITAAADLFLEVLNNLVEGVLIVDASNTVLYVNDAYTRITGAEKEDVLGTNLSQSRPGSRMQEILTSGRMEMGVHRIYGNREHVSNIVPIYKDQRLIGGVSIASSVSDLESISQKLKEDRENLELLQKRVASMKQTKFTFDDIIAVSPLSKDLKEQARKLAKKDISILLTGESGTGKEVFAQAIHNESPRRAAPFIALNCSAISPELVESELFGYEGNAFTGAKKGGHKGIFEAAEGGTVFLDEIGELGFPLQAKLLRVLQEQAVRPIGSTVEKPINVRILSATNRDLSAMVAEGTFRTDLYYRIAPMVLRLPPLRERREDILPLLKLNLEKEGKKNKKNLRLDEKVLGVLLNYSWPGNIRELVNILTVAAILCESDTIHLQDFPPRIFQGFVPQTPQKICPLKKVAAAAEANVIYQALKEYGSDVAAKKEISRKLEISLATLYNKIKEYQLEEL